MIAIHIHKFRAKCNLYPLTCLPITQSPVLSFLADTCDDLFGIPTNEFEYKDTGLDALIMQLLEHVCRKAQLISLNDENYEKRLYDEYRSLYKTHKKHVQLGTSTVPLNVYNKVWYKNPKDLFGRSRGEPGYNSSEIYVPQLAYKEMTSAQQHYWKLKSTRFDKLLFFKVGKLYQLYSMDAQICHALLGLDFIESKNDMEKYIEFDEKFYCQYVQIIIKHGYNYEDQFEDIRSMKSLSNTKSKTINTASLKIEDSKETELLVLWPYKFNIVKFAVKKLSQINGCFTFIHKNTPNSVICSALGIIMCARTEYMRCKEIRETLETYLIENHVIESILWITVVIMKYGCNDGCSMRNMVLKCCITVLDTLGQNKVVAKCIINSGFGSMLGDLLPPDEAAKTVSGYIDAVHMFINCIITVVNEMISYNNMVDINHVIKQLSSVESVFENHQLMQIIFRSSAKMKNVKWNEIETGTVSIDITDLVMHSHIVGDVSYLTHYTTKQSWLWYYHLIQSGKIEIILTSIQNHCLRCMTNYDFDHVYDVNQFIQCVCSFATTSIGGMYELRILLIGYSRLKNKGKFYQVLSNCLQRSMDSINQLATRLEQICSYDATALAMTKANLHVNSPFKVKSVTLDDCCTDQPKITSSQMGEVNILLKRIIIKYQDCPVMQVIQYWNKYNKNGSFGFNINFNHNGNGEPLRDSINVICCLFKKHQLFSLQCNKGRQLLKSDEAIYHYDIIKFDKNKSWKLTNWTNKLLWCILQLIDYLIDIYMIKKFDTSGIQLCLKNAIQYLTKRHKHKRVTSNFNILNDIEYMVFAVTAKYCFCCLQNIYQAFYCYSNALDRANTSQELMIAQRGILVCKICANMNVDSIYNYIRIQQLTLQQFYIKEGKCYNIHNRKSECQRKLIDAFDNRATLKRKLSLSQSSKLRLFFKQMQDESSVKNITKHDRNLLSLLCDSDNLTVIRNVLGLKQCNWINCKNKKAKLRLCACKQIYYCSRICQKKDWKCSIFGNIPHRIKCNIRKA